MFKKTMESVVKRRRLALSNAGDSLLEQLPRNMFYCVLAFISVGDWHNAVAPLCSSIHATFTQIDRSGHLFQSQLQRYIAEHCNWFRAWKINLTEVYVALPTSTNNSPLADAFIVQEAIDLPVAPKLSIVPKSQVALAGHARGGRGRCDNCDDNKTDIDKWEVVLKLSEGSAAKWLMDDRVVCFARAWERQRLCERCLGENYWVLLCDECQPQVMIVTKKGWSMRLRGHDVAVCQHFE